MGEGHSVIIIIPADLPDAETYTVSVSDKDIRFKAGYDEITAIDYPGGEIFQRIANNTQVGLVEHSEDPMPGHITNIAYVEVRRAH
jgi:hypothetical protein